MSCKAAILLLIVTGAAPRVLAQHPLTREVDAYEVRFARSQPVVSYTLRLDPADRAGFEVELRVRNLPDSFRLAMAAHPEYDDRYWRYVTGLRAEGTQGPARIVREDSAVWRVAGTGGQAVIRYRLQLPEPAPAPAVRAAWRPFLSATGGLAGGPHSFMYILGAELAPAHVVVQAPQGWEIATGLEPTSDPGTYFAPSVDVLMDSPILVGRFHRWRFAVDGVPHRVIYWAAPDAAAFDTTSFVSSIEKMVRGAVALFGRAPYREYTFLFQDAAYGGLEHLNSVTLGAPSADLARDPLAYLQETAHEYFHTWNLMRIRPAEYRSVDYRTQPPVAGLWFSEGLTLFYADLLLRRAAVPRPDTTRIRHLESLIGRYLANPGNARFAAESVSRVAYNASPAALGDYRASTHLQGELIGAMLDLVVRSATGGRRSMDDVMRKMLDEFAGERGFTGRDVERTVAEVCRCSVQPLFDRYVRAGHPMDFDRYLRLIGLRSRVSWKPTLREGQPEPDLRFWAWQPQGEQQLRLIVGHPDGVWARAGLHTGDRLRAVNGTAITAWPELRAILTGLRVGDTLEVEVMHPGGPWRTSVTVAGYQSPEVRLEELPDATEGQRRLREQWLRGES